MIRSLVLALALVLGPGANLGSSAVLHSHARGALEAAPFIALEAAVSVALEPSLSTATEPTASFASSPTARVVRATMAKASPVPATRSASELQIPKNEGWVTDTAHLLSADQKRELSNLMESYKQGTTHEIAVLIVPSLNGAPLEQFALEVGRAWGMGTKEKNNAALLLVAKNDRKIRIEVARGLEGSLTDAISGSIIRNVIAPNFKRGQFYEGIKAGVVAMHEAIGGKYGALPHGGEAVGAGLIGCLIPFFFFLFVLIMIVARLKRGGGGVRRRGWWIGGPPFMGGSSWGGGGFGGGGGGGGGGFSGFGGGGGFSGGGSSGGW